MPSFAQAMQLRRSSERAPAGDRLPRSGLVRSQFIPTTGKIGVQGHEKSAEDANTDRLSQFPLACCLPTDKNRNEVVYRCHFRSSIAMRQIAVVPTPTTETCRLMIYEREEGSGTYLFLFRTLEDGAGFADYWFESVGNAVEAAREEFGVSPTDWQSIPDPPAGCQHDWIAPVRLAQDAAGYPLNGQFERESESPDPRG